MENKISILIVDDNVEFCELLKQYINRCDDMSTAGVARDGYECIEMIDKLNPDIVILDIIMPNLDGIGVLEKVNDMEFRRRPMFVVLSAIGQDLLARKAMELGAEYYIVKPFDIEILIKRIKDIYFDRIKKYRFRRAVSGKNAEIPGYDLPKQRSVEYEVTSLMRDVGVPAHLSGYRYLREAIIMVVNNSKVFTSITKVLYPSVAESLNSTPQKVERSIRNAIDAAWIKDSNCFRRVLLNGFEGHMMEKPTNSQFIAMVAERVKMKVNL